MKEIKSNGLEDIISQAIEEIYGMIYSNEIHKSILYMLLVILCRLRITA